MSLVPEDWLDPAWLEVRADLPGERNVLRNVRQMVRHRDQPPLWVRYYDFGVGRMPCYLQELAAQNQADGRADVVGSPGGMRLCSSCSRMGSTLAAAVSFSAERFGPPMPSDTVRRRWREVSDTAPRREV